jgi:hypothetical protein
MSFASMAGASGAVQAPASAASVDSALTCGLGAFGESDERLFGESYAFARARSTDRDPPERKQVVSRLDRQLQVCKRRHKLSRAQLQIVNIYAANQILLRGAAWYLNSQGSDPARLDPLAERISAEDASSNPGEAFVARHAGSFNEAGVPQRLHAAAADYLVFTRRNAFFRTMWASERPTPPSAN